MKLEISNLSFKLNKAYFLFKNLELVIDSGQIINIFSPESVGKSTLLRILNLDLKPAGGSVIYLGKFKYPEIKVKDRRFLKRSIGYIPQNPEFFKNRTVLENLKVISSYRDGMNKKTKKDIDFLLYSTKLFGLKNKYPHELSLSERQRLAFARAMLSKPSIILADQPFNNLNRERRKHFEEIVETTNNEGTTWVITSIGQLTFSTKITSYMLTESELTL